MAITFNKIEQTSQVLTDAQKEVFKTADNFFKTGLETRRAYEIQWYRNMAFFLGYHYIEWDNYKGTLKIPLKPSWRIRAVVNHIQSNVMHTAAKLSKNRGMFTTIPLDASNDMATNASESSKIALQWVQQRNQTALLQQDLYMMMYIYGTAYKQAYWNPLIGRSVAYIPGENGEKGRRLMEGDVAIRVLSPFDVVWEDGATDLDESQQIGIIFNMSLDEVRSRFKYGNFCKPERTRAQSAMENTLISLMKKKYVSDQDASGPLTDEDPKKAEENRGFVSVKQYLSLPNDKHPKGRQIFIGGGILLDDEEPLPHEYMQKYKCFGLQKYDYIHLHERWVGETPVNQQIPIQMKINRTHSAIQEIENEMVKPKWIVHKMSGIERTAIDNEPGEIIRHNTPVGYPEPHTSPGAEINPSLFASLELDSKSMEVASALHEVSKGMNVPGVESKVAMAFMQEQDQTVYSTVQTRVEIKDEEFYTWCLELVKEKYKEPRMLTVLGIDNEIESYDFEMTDNFPTRVKVIPGSTFPVSQAAKQQTILNFLMGGAFGPMETVPESLRMRIMTVAEVGDVDTIYKELRIDIKEAQREQKLWMKGMRTAVKTYDNHKVHVETHRIFQKTDMYRIFEQTNPELANWIEEHINVHTEQTAEYQAMQQQNTELAEQKDLMLGDKAIERSQKNEEIKGKTAERMLSLMKAQQGSISNEQTVKE